MAKVAITEQYLTDIADAIRSKTGLSNTFFPAEMAPAILTISGSGGITPSGTINITSNNTYDVTRYASAVVNVPVGSTINNQDKNVTPTESSQTITADSGYTGLGTVTVGAISDTYVGSAIDVNPTPTASGATVTIPAGYYEAQTSKSVTTATHAKPTASINSTTGLVTASHTQTAGYVSAGTTTGTLQLTTQAAATITPSTSSQTAVAAGRYTLGAVTVAAVPTETKTVTVNGDVTPSTGKFLSKVTVNVPTGSAINNQDKTVSPTTSEQTITADSGYTGLGTVTVNAMPTMTLPTTVASSATSGYTKKITIGRSTTNQYVNIPTGYNSAGAYYEISAVANGTAGTPTATKGTVSNHSISVTPSVTNTTGYITGSTKTGTAVTVSASELVSGTLSVTSNGTKDVTNYASVSVNISGDSPTIETLTVTPSESEQSFDASDVDGYKPVTVSAISSTYVGSGIARKSASDVTGPTWQYTSNDTYGYVQHTINIPAGYYSSDTTKSFTKIIADITDIPKKAATTITPTESVQTAVAKFTWTTGDITVAAIPSTYIGSGITQRSSTDLTTSGATVSVPAGYYSAAVSKSIDSANLTFNSVTNNEPIVASTSNKLTFIADVNVRTASDSVGGYVASGQQALGTVKVYLYSDKSYFSDNSGLTTSGATVTVPAGYYSSSVSKSVASGSATAPASISGTAASISTGSGTLTLTKTVSVTPRVTTAGYVTAGTAGNSSVSLTANVTIDPTPTASGATVTIPAGYYTESTTKSVSSGSATGPTSLTGSSATVSTGTNTLTLTKTGVTTTPTVSAGYVSSATASTATVTLTASVTTKAAATITPTTTNQTIASGTYLTGTQTIAGDADLVGGNILSTANIFGVQGEVVVQNYYTGSSAPSSSLGQNGDIYIQQ